VAAILGQEWAFEKLKAKVRHRVPERRHEALHVRMSPDRLRPGVVLELDVFHEDRWDVPNVVLVEELEVAFEERACAVVTEPLGRRI
jgi:hypothetical protein